MSTLVKYKPPFKKMQFVMKCTTLLEIDSSLIQAPNKYMQFITKYTTLLHIDPSQV